MHPNHIAIVDLQLKDLEDNLADVLTSCEFVDRALDNATSTQLLLVKKQVDNCLLFFSVNRHFQVGEGLKNTPSFEAAVPIDSDYIELSWERLEDAKDSINSIGSLISSSCIPSLSSAGLLQIAFYIFNLTI